MSKETLKLIEELIDLKIQMEIKSLADAPTWEIANELESIRRRITSS